MKLLVIGGGVFVGRAMAAQAMARGHQVSVFNRGKTSAEGVPGVEWIKGDRNGDLGALRGRTWDAVIDACAYYPRQVRSLLGAMSGNLRHYTLISTISAYADLTKPGTREDSPLSVPLESTEEKMTPENYGPLKSACEDAARRSGLGEVLIIRPGIIAGPRDPTGRFPYWVSRVARGGEILAPGNPNAPVQLIDTRDLGEWVVAMVESGAVGAFNAVGSPSLSYAEMLSTCAECQGSHSRFTWASDEFLEKHGVADWSKFPFYLPGAHPKAQGMFNIDGSAAIRRGLILRPFAETAMDTFLWLKDGTVATALGTVGLPAEREAELLGLWRATQD